MKFHKIGRNQITGPRHMLEIVKTLRFYFRTLLNARILRLKANAILTTGWEITIEVRYWKCEKYYSYTIWGWYCLRWYKVLKKNFHTSTFWFSTVQILNVNWRLLYSENSSICIVIQALFTETYFNMTALPVIPEVASSAVFEIEWCILYSILRLHWCTRFEKHYEVET